VTGLLKRIAGDDSRAVVPAVRERFYLSTNAKASLQAIGVHIGRRMVSRSVLHAASSHCIRRRAISVELTLMSNRCVDGRMGATKQKRRQTPSSGKSRRPSALHLGANIRLRKSRARDMLPAPQGSL